MLGVQDMLADMLKKAIPEEVMALLTPDQIQAMGEKINAFVTDIRENFQTIIARQADDHTSIMNEIGALREEILNHVGSNKSAGNGSNSSPRKRNGSASSDGQ